MTKWKTIKMKSNLKKGKNKMTVKDLIKYLKKMPQTKEVYFFNHNNERLYDLDEGVWNIPNEKDKSQTYVNWVEIAGKMM